VVVIERDLVMQSDVRFEKVMAGLDNAAYPFWQRERSTPLQRLIDAAIIRKLAGTVSLYQPDPEDVVNRMESIRTKFGALQAWADFLKFWGLDEVSFIRLLHRRMVVERYLSRNLQTSADNLNSWQLDYETLMDQVRKRYRIRHIPLESAER